MAVRHCCRCCCCCYGAYRPVNCHCYWLTATECKTGACATAYPSEPPPPHPWKSCCWSSRIQRLMAAVAAAVEEALQQRAHAIAACHHDNFLSQSLFWSQLSPPD